MKDKLVSMAPFFVIMLLVLGWGAMQGWFTPAPTVENDPSIAEAPPLGEAGGGSSLSRAPEPTPNPSEEGNLKTLAPPTTMNREKTPQIPAPTPTSDSTTSESGATSWSTYHGDEQLAGVIDVVLPKEPKRRWRFQANGPIYHGPVASKERIHFVTDTGEVFGVDFQGVKAWSRQLTRIDTVNQEVKPARVDGPVSCFEETVLVGTMAGVVHALDAATGTLKWKTDIDNSILGAITMQRATATHATRLYVIGQDDGTLHCLALADGTLLWQSESIDRCDGSPTSGAGILAFGSCASALHVLSAENGAILKDISLGNEAQVAGGVANRGNSLFSGSQSGEVFHADLEKGAIVWTNNDAESEVFTTPAVSASHVVFGSMDDNFYALDRATGTLLWKFETNGLTMSPVIARDTVVASSGGVLYLLALENGKKSWSFEVSDEITSPSIIDGMIVVGSDDGTLSAFGT